MRTLLFSLLVSGCSALPAQTSTPTPDTELIIKRLDRIEQRLERWEAEYPRFRREWLTMQERLGSQHVQNHLHFTARFKTLEHLLGMRQPVMTLPDGEPAEGEIRIGNFLADGGSWTSMVLMSDYLHNGATSDRAASDAVRPKIIQRAKSFGDTIHLYGTNDDNYSQRRPNPPEGWIDIPNRALFYDITNDSAHWYHWFVECRKAGLTIVLWLWPNDASATYNNPAVWPDNRVVEQMQRLIAFARQEWDGAPLATDFVLKLEADDEWNAKRINRIALQLREFLKPTERLWYHNQTDSIAVLQQIDWAQFHGLRYQWRGGSEMDEAQFKGAFREVIQSLPDHLLFVGSEYGPNGQSPAVQQRGDWALEMRREFPGRIVGVDNGATRERWVQP